MCGIIGYTGKKKVLPILLDGLKSLEYRGYDSAGVAYIYKNEVNTIKSIGKISNLEAKIDLSIPSNAGIGHTRWATHGGVTINNCHPHTQGNVTLVHNGIIENYLDLKKLLVENGYHFVGECDSEILAGLIDFYYKKFNDKIKALEMTMKNILGSYAVGIIFHDEVDKIYAIRKDSPLIIGISNDGNFIVSDMLAIIRYTNKYIILDKNEISVISSNDYKIYKNGKIIDKEVMSFGYQSEDNSLAGYDHYMLKEIHEEASLVRNNLPVNLEDIPDIRKYNNIYIVGCGSAYHAGMIGKYLLEEYTDKMVITEIASEFRYKKLFVNKNDLVIVISQSGETADTLASLRIAKEHGATVLGIVNVFGSSIAREADKVIYTKALAEVAVATTKAYLMQVFMLGLLAIKNSNIEYDSVLEDYKKLANQIDFVVNNSEYKKIAKMLYKCHDIYFLGRGIDYAVAMEGSLKLKEISYIHSEAYAAGELKHGTISLIEDGTVVISVITDIRIKDKTISNIKEVISRGAKSIVICSEDIDIDSEYYDKLIRVPSNIYGLSSMLSVIPLQLISYEVAKLKGCDIDKPRNLAKSVTVE